MNKYKKRLKPIHKNEIEAIQNQILGEAHYAFKYKVNLVKALEELKDRLYKKKSHLTVSTKEDEK